MLYDIIPFKTGMTWKEFYLSYMNGYLAVEIPNYDFNSTTNEIILDAKITGYDVEYPEDSIGPYYCFIYDEGDGNNIYRRHVYTNDDNYVNWDDVIQPVTDSETMYPHYYVQF
jgi:hypothetical protein